MKAIIETEKVFEAKYFEGCFTFKLRSPIAGKNYGVINYETKGKEKLVNLKTGDFLSVEVKYKIGPEAILITEIL